MERGAADLVQFGIYHKHGSLFSLAPIWHYLRIWLGCKGNEWAWRANKWRNEKEFLRRKVLGLSSNDLLFSENTFVLAYVVFITASIIGISRIPRSLAT